MWEGSQTEEEEETEGEGGAISKNGKEEENLKNGEILLSQKRKFLDTKTRCAATEAAEVYRHSSQLESSSRARVFLFFLEKREERGRMSVCERETFDVMMKPPASKKIAKSIEARV